MSTWIATLINCVFLPLVMLAEGTFFVKCGGPKKISHLRGYRTRWAMLNEDTWRFAHRHCGRIWIVCGWVLLALSLITALCLLGQSDYVCGVACSVVFVVQLVVAVPVSVILTERALRRTFDKEGKRL